MIPLKGADDISVMKEGGRRLAVIMNKLVAALKPGFSARELDELAQQLIEAGGDAPAFLHYRPPGSRQKYPATLCVSINDEVVHGVPSGRVLQAGDLVSLDLGLGHQGLFVDMAITAALGEPSREVKKLLAATQEALGRAVETARPGKRLGDIGAAIEETAKKYGLGLVTALGGHGVGRAVHEEPPVPNFGEAGSGLELKAGMTFALEPMFTLGGGEVKFIPGEFTVKTADGSLAAHFEHTVVITENGSEILTKI